MRCQRQPARKAASGARSREAALVRAIPIPPSAMAKLREFLVELNKFGLRPAQMMLLDLGIGTKDAAARVPPLDLQDELLRPVLEGWYGRFGERAVMTAEVLRVARKDMSTESRRLDLALRGLAVFLGRPLTPQLLSCWLRTQKQIELNGKAFFPIGSRNNTVTWGVRILKS